MEHKKQHMNLGQIAINTGIAVSIFLASIGGWLAQNQILDNKIEETKKANTEVIQRVSKLEEAVATIKDDNREIKGDIKQILKEVKK